MELSYRQARRLHSVVRRTAATRPMAKLFSVIQQPIDQLIYRLSRRRTTASEWLSGLEIAMLTTTGARTGIPRTVPVLPLPDGDRTILIASNFGRTHHPSWYHNLRADPNATIVLGGALPARWSHASFMEPSGRSATDAGKRSSRGSVPIAGGRSVRSR